MRLRFSVHQVQNHTRDLLSCFSVAGTLMCGRPKILIAEAPSVPAAATYRSPGPELKTAYSVKAVIRHSSSAVPVHSLAQIPFAAHSHDPPRICSLPVPLLKAKARSLAFCLLLPRLGMSSRHAHPWPEAQQNKNSPLPLWQGSYVRRLRLHIVSSLDPFFHSVGGHCFKSCAGHVGGCILCL